MKLPTITKEWAKTTKDQKAVVREEQAQVHVSTGLKRNHRAYTKANGSPQPCNSLHFQNTRHFVHTHVMFK